MNILIIGPSSNYISGSLLRPLNIWYSLKDLDRVINIKFMSIKSFSYIPFHIKYIRKADVVIISGVNPWVAAIFTIIGKIFSRIVVVDFHGFSWYESSITNSSIFIMRVLLLISEFLIYKLAGYIIASSIWLAKKLEEYFGSKKNVNIIENSTTPIFEKLVNILENYNIHLLRRFVYCKILLQPMNYDKIILTAPLPKIFKSNVLAYKLLVSLFKELPENLFVVVTGIEHEEVNVSNIINVGYLSYPMYVTLLILTDVIVLPYPNNAICGGVRNKVIEAGYCRKPIISTNTGMMHTYATPNIHYIPFNKETIHHLARDASSMIPSLNAISSRFHTIVLSRYVFKNFKIEFLKLLKRILSVC